MKDFIKNLFNKKRPETVEIDKNYQWASEVDENDKKRTVPKLELSEIGKENLLAQSIQKTPKDFNFVQIKRSADGQTTSQVAIQDAKFAGESSTLTKYFQGSSRAEDFVYSFFAKGGFIGHQLCGIIAQHWLVNKICCMPSEKAISTDYKVKSLDKELEWDKVKRTGNEKYKLAETAKRLSQKTRIFGVGYAIPVFKDGQEPDMAVPMSLEAIKKNSLIRFNVIDAYWCIPQISNFNNPTDKDFFEPSHYSLPNGKTIHSSWIFKLINEEVMDILKPTYFFGGLPIPQKIMHSVYIAEKTRNETFELARSKRLTILDLNPLAFLNNQRQAQEQLKAMEFCRSNFAILLKSKDQNVQQLDTSLAGFSEIVMDNYQVACAAGGVAATEILETQPKGFNSAGNYEEKQSKFLQKTICNNHFVPFLNWAYDIVLKSETDEIIDADVEFDDIDVPTEKERAEINSTNANTAAKYFEIGVVSQEDVAQFIKEDKNNLFNSIDIEPVDFDENEGE